MHSKEHAALKLERLIPKRVLEIAARKDHVRTIIERSPAGLITVLVYEEKYPEQLTDSESWKKWRESTDEHRAKLPLPSGIGRPQIPEGIDRLHARFEKKISSGQVSIEDRIMFVCQLKLNLENSNSVHVASYDGIKGQGIATEFYLQTLPAFAKAMGASFITGMNNADNIDYFIKKIGRVHLSDIKQELRKLFFPNTDLNSPFVNTLLTVQFLNPKDRLKYCVTTKVAV